MGAFGTLVLTDKGRALVSKIQTGVTVHFNRVGVGDGVLGAQPITGLNALINEKKSLAITKLRVQSTVQTLIGCVLSNKDVTEGFYFREFGIFAQDPDDGEVLYCYGNAGESAEFINPDGGAQVIEKAIDVSILVGNAANVTADIASGIYATAEDVGDMSTVPTTAKSAAGAIAELHSDQEAHASRDDNPHAVTAAQVGAVPATSYTPADVMAKMKTVDGAGSGLDADLLDGKESGNGSGQIPINNGVLNTGLNAEKVNGWSFQEDPNGDPQYSINGGALKYMGGVYNVLRGTTIFGANDSSIDVTIAPTKPLNKLQLSHFSFKVGIGSGDTTDVMLEQAFFIGKLTSATNLRIERTRNTFGYSTTAEVSWEISENN